ncbi:MAG: ABC transporter permease [Gammaproteobacteria bacterium]|nr:ABC transporter permease [Gammaproteobacteria bacterium]
MSGPSRDDPKPSTGPALSALRGPVVSGLLSLLLLALCLVLWWAVAWWFELPPLVLPLPGDVARVLVRNLIDGTFWPHLLVTLTEIALGFAIGSGLGIGLGSLVALSPFLQRVLHPYVIASQAMPKLALAPIFVIWFGFGILPKAAIAALICFFPLFENTLVGLRSVQDDAVELFRMFGASRWQQFVHLRMPNALPYVFAGLRVSIVLSVVGAVVGEFVGANQGLGALIMASQGMMDTPLMFAVFVLLTLVGVALYELLALCERLVMRRRSRIVPLVRLPGGSRIRRKSSYGSSPESGEG